MSHVIPIASLSAQSQVDHDTFIRAVVTLVWPYSSRTEQCSLLLAEPDARLRHRQGQVRVHFTHESAHAIAAEHISIGDEIQLRLNGAKWAQTESTHSSDTPGRSVDGELVFHHELCAEVRRAGQAAARLIHVKELPSPKVIDPPTSSAVASVPLTPIIAHKDHSSLAYSGLSNRLHESPAFAKGSTLSSSSAQFVDELARTLDSDVLDDGSPRKRQRGPDVQITPWRYLRDVDVDNNRNLNALLNDQGDMCQDEDSSTSASQHARGATAPSTDFSIEHLPANSTVDEAVTAIVPTVVSSLPDASEVKTPVLAPSIPKISQEAEMQLETPVTAEHSHAAHRVQHEHPDPAAIHLSEQAERLGTPDTPIEVDADEVGQRTTRGAASQSDILRHTSDDDYIATVGKLTPQHASHTIITDPGIMTSPDEDRRTDVSAASDQIPSMAKGSNLRVSDPVTVVEASHPNDAFSYEMPPSSVSQSIGGETTPPPDIPQAPNVDDVTQAQSARTVYVDYIDSSRMFSSDAPALHSMPNNVPQDQDYDVGSDGASLSRTSRSIESAENSPSAITHTAPSAEDEVYANDEARLDTTDAAWAEREQAVHSESWETRSNARHAIEETPSISPEQAESPFETFEDDYQSESGDASEQIPDELSQTEQASMDDNTDIQSIDNTDTDERPTYEAPMAHTGTRKHSEPLSNDNAHSDEERAPKTATKSPQPVAALVVAADDVLSGGDEQSDPGLSLTVESFDDAPATPAIQELDHRTEIESQDVVSQSISASYEDQPPARSASSPASSGNSHEHLPASHSHDVVIDTELHLSPRARDDIFDGTLEPSPDWIPRPIVPVVSEQPEEDTQPQMGTDEALEVQIDSDHSPQEQQDGTMSSSGESDSRDDHGSQSVAQMELESSYLSEYDSPAASVANETIGVLEQHTILDPSSPELESIDNDNIRLTDFTGLNENTIVADNTGDVHLSEFIATEYLAGSPVAQRISGPIELNRRVVDEDVPRYATGARHPQLEYNITESAAPSAPVVSDSERATAGLPKADAKQAHVEHEIADRNGARSVEVAMQIQSRRKSRLSVIPGVLDKWFTPTDSIDRRKSAFAIVHGQTQAAKTPRRTSSRIRERSQSAGLEQARPLLPTKTRDEARGYATNLSYYHALCNLKPLLNTSTTGIDVLAIVTTANALALKSKAGPRDWFTFFHVTDPSFSPTDKTEYAIIGEDDNDDSTQELTTQRKSRDVRVDVFRPYKASLPVVEPGDVVLLRNFVVKSRKRQLYLLSAGSSAWCVWKFDGKSKAEEAEEQVHGPPVEFGSQERSRVRELRAWWMLAT